MAERTVRPDLVVVNPPALDDPPSIVQAGEPMQVQALVPELAVEAFDESVLSRLARLNEVQLYAGTSRPEEQRLAGQFRAVVADDGCR